MEFYKPEYWSGLPFPSPEDLPSPRIEPRSPVSWADSLPVWHFNTPLTLMNRSSRQNFNKPMLALNNMLNQMELIDIFRTYHPNTAEYIYFSSAC